MHVCLMRLPFVKLQRDASERLPVGEAAQCGGALVERVGFRDEWPDVPLLGEFAQICVLAPAHLRVVPAGFAGANANDRAASEQDAIGGVGWNVPAGKSEDEQFAAPCQTAQGILLHESDRIEKQIGAASLR